MADNKKYYYLKIKENFFDSNELKVLQGMKDGYKYSDILLKLYLRSLRQEGKLMLRGNIPYNSEMLSSVTGHDVGTIDRAIKIFKELGLIDILDSGAIYMTDIQSFIGKSTTEADRKREYRTRINAEKFEEIEGKETGQMSGQTSDKCTDNDHIDGTNVHQRLEIRDKSIEIRDKDITDTYVSVRQTASQKEAVRHIISAWNTLSVYGIAQVPKVSSGSKRYSNLVARINEYGEEEVLKAIDRIKISDFLQGKSGKGWTITFDWFVLPSNFPKVHDGNYDNRGTGFRQQSSVEQFAERAKRWAND